MPTNPFDLGDPRQLPVRKFLGIGIPAVLLIVVFAYVVSVLWWSFWLTLGAHWGGLGWSYTWTATHWGLLCPFVVG